jgi:hypothetical protein
LTDPLSLALTFAAAIVAAGIAWVQWPRPPALDGERWFKVLLATLLRGRVEHDGGDAESWERTVLRLVPYGDNAAAKDQLLDDPTELGPAYDPATWLGPGLGWDAIARHPADEAVAAAVARVLAARWILVEGRPGRLVGPTLLPALRAELGDAIVVPFGDGNPEALGEIATEALPDAGDRLVLAGEEAGVARLVHLLHDNDALRDRVVAVLSIGGVIGGRDDEDGPYGTAARADWMAASFRQRELETDVVRLTPWLSLQWLGASGLSLEAQRFPEPDAEGATARTLEVVDLGPLPIDPALDPAIVARALVAITTLWVASRR